MAVIGWFGEDIWDAAVDVASSVVDRATDVIRVIPGAEELADALTDLIEGPLRDFARTPWGMVILRAMATTIYGPLAWEIGPQAASIAFALPGLARGQDFWEAWFDELAWRTQKTIEIVGPGAGDAIMKSFGSAVAQLKVLVPEGLNAISPAEIAHRIGIPSDFPLEAWAKHWGITEWDAAMLRNMIDPAKFPLKREDFDLAGKQLPKLSAGAARILRSVASKISLVPKGATTKVTPVAVSSPVSVVASPPVTASQEAGVEPRASSLGDAALVLVLAAGVATAAWFYLDE